MATNAGIKPIADARADLTDLAADEVYQRNWGLTARVDPRVTFEEYIYWAKIERAEELEANRIYVEERGPLSVSKVIKGRFSKGIHHENKKKMAQQAITQSDSGSGSDEKSGFGVVGAKDTPSSMAVSPEEWKQAARALKTASWGTIFFLITTDILGWSTTP